MLVESAIPQSAGPADLPFAKWITTQHFTSWERSMWRLVESATPLSAGPADLPFAE